MDKNHNSRGNFWQMFSQSVVTQFGAISARMGKMRWCFCLPKPYFFEYCCILDIRCLSISPSPPVLCSMVNLQYILTGSNSSETVILTVVWDRFWHERVGYRPADSIVGPTSLNHTRIMIIERLSTCGTSQEPSQWTKTITAGVIVGRCFRCLMAQFGAILARIGKIRWCFCLPKP